MNLFQGIFAILIKDVQAELRSRYATNTVLAFVGSSLLLILFTLNAEQLSAPTQSALVWIIILFAALSSLSRSFVMETDRRTFNLLRLDRKSTRLNSSHVASSYPVFFLHKNINHRR